MGLRIGHTSTERVPSSRSGPPLSGQHRWRRRVPKPPPTLNSSSSTRISARILTRECAHAQTEHSAAADAVIDSALAALAEREEKWSRQSLTGRRALFDRVRALTGQHAQDWVDAAVGIKGLDPSSPLVGEEWMSGPYVLAASLAALESLEQGTSPLAKAKFAYARDRVTVQALPSNLYDELLLSGFRAEVWLQPGITEASAKASAGLAQLGPTRTGGIAAVLGAGNISSIAPLDTIYELIAHNRVVALKLNPVTDPLLPVFERIFAPLIELG